jgi:hypothetical protein
MNLFFAAGLRDLLSGSWPAADARIRALIVLLAAVPQLLMLQGARSFGRIASYTALPSGRMGGKTGRRRVRLAFPGCAPAGWRSLIGLPVAV